MAEKRVAKVTHYWAKIGVAGIKLYDTLKVGDTIHISGSTTDFEQTVDSMEIEHEAVEVAKKGYEVGLKVNERVRKGDRVYKVD
jgi:translation elongation factor EF-1alpha